MNAPNLDPSALEAAADRYLGDLRGRRVAKAESNLAVAKRQLADAEADATTAAAEYATHSWDGSKRRVLETREAIELATALVEHREREVVRARKRTAPLLRAKAIAKVKAEREWEGLAARRIAHRAKVVAVARKLFDVLSKGGEIYMDALALQHSISDAAQAFDPVGAANIRQRYAVPLPGALDADAIAEACRGQGFSPLDLRTLAQGAVDAATAHRAAMVPPGMPRKVQPLDERLAHQRKVNEDNMEKWAREAHQNDLASLASQYVPRVTDHGEVAE